MYELLPFVYAASGVAAVWLSGEIVGKISGVLLVTAALFIFRMRLEYRQKGGKPR
jgi:hypothetical protein